MLMKRIAIHVLILFVMQVSAYSRGDDSTRNGNSTELIPIDEFSIGKLLNEMKGKVVLLNVWATWCGPCVREFPHLVKLQRDYHEKGLEVLFISIDDPNIAETRVKPFLKKQKVFSPAYIKKASDDRRFFIAVGKGFGNAIPTTFVYDRQGKQVQALVGARDYETFENVIKPLLVSTD